MRLQDPQCDEVVKEAWHDGLFKLSGCSFENCMENYRDRLISWNKLEFSHVGLKIAKL